MIKRRRNDDYIGPSKGWAKFFHRLFLIVTFPLRRPWWFLLILVLMFLAPTFNGVKPAEVHLWYWSKIKQFFVSTTDKAQKIFPSTVNVSTPKSATKPQKVQVIDRHTKTSGRKMFERAKSAPVVVRTQINAKIEPKKSVVAIQEKNKSIVKSENKRNLKLKYLSEPKKVSGKAIIQNANELIINEEYVFLYGIYAEPNSENGIKAETYLRSETEGKTVECMINAYTYQNIATAICSASGVELNRELVNLGYSKNVALD